MSRFRKLLLGMALAGMILATAELVPRLLLGPPPAQASLVPLSAAELVYEGPTARLSHAVSADQDRVFGLANLGDLRVVVLGGSSVHHSWAASEKVNFPTWLDQQLPEVEVLNLGVPGQNTTGLVHQAGQLEGLEPDLVVVYTGHNDFGEAVFRGDVGSSALWSVPILQVLSYSWLYSWLDRSAEPVLSADPNQREGRIHVLHDDFAIESQPQILENWKRNIEALQQESPAPIVLSTLARNADWPPSGTLVGQQGDAQLCSDFAQTIRGRPGAGVEGKARQAATDCGPDSALALWLEAQALQRRGRQQEAEAALAASFDADPLPIRAPAVLDDVIVSHAAQLGVPVLDLREAIGPWLGGENFDDTLHPSVEGAKRLASAMAPFVREHLGEGAE